jgi:hypothetical protein
MGKLQPQTEAEHQGSLSSLYKQCWPSIHLGHGVHTLNESVQNLHLSKAENKFVRTLTTSDFSASKPHKE